MADDNKDELQKQQKPRRGNMFMNLASRVQDNVRSLYRNTFYTDMDDKQQLNAIRKDMSASIKQIMDINMDNSGEPNISRLYERLMYTQSDKSSVDEIEKIFGDNDFINNLTASYMDTRWVKELDIEIDTVIKYMPKLQEALLTIRDNVLSSDSFSKDYLNLESKFGVSDSDKIQFSRNIEQMKDEYDLLELTTEIYDDTSKYGESFIYRVPYDKAIQKLINNKNKMPVIGFKSNKENAIIIESGGLTDKIKIDGYSEEKDGVIDFHINMESGLISSIINNEKYIRDKKKIIKEQSITESFMNESYIDSNRKPLNESDLNPSSFIDSTEIDIENGKLPKHRNFDSTLSSDMPLPSEVELTNDGFTDRSKGGSSASIKKMNGALIKKLDRDKVLPITINKVCLGYYVFEVDTKVDVYGNSNVRGTSNLMANTLGTMSSVNRNTTDLEWMTRREELVKTIASNIAEKINADFINTNQDLKEEIYHILKYNEEFSNSITNGGAGINVSYVPPEDIEHFYFKLDESTGRGISDLALSLIPAKLWVAIYITNCLAIMIRGNDKRVYYVKQSVEANIAKTLLKTINEIKKSNFGIRQVESINSVLNITGRFNDYIIPRGSDGQSPVEFEVMPGQQIEIKTELMNMLEESAINIIGIPIETIQSRQSPDYAIQLTMSSSKFLRFVYARQSRFQKQMGDFLTAIYDMEYLSSDRLNLILPPPLFINVTNTNQLIVNTNDYCENIGNMLMANEPDENLKAEFIKELKIYNLGSYMKMDVMEQLINKAKQNNVRSLISNPDNMEQGE